MYSFDSQNTNDKHCTAMGLVGLVSWHDQLFLRLFNAKAILLEEQ